MGAGADGVSGSGGLLLSASLMKFVLSYLVLVEGGNNAPREIWIITIKQESICNNKSDRGLGRNYLSKTKADVSQET